MDCLLMDRRDFVRLGLTAGLGFVLRAPTLRAVIGEEPSKTLRPSAFVALNPDGVVTFWVTRQEMGQGVRTGLPMILAEELDVDLDALEIVQAELDERYGAQRTGGSLSVRELWTPLRRAGATMREMLLRAAADRWEIPRGEVETRPGLVVHPREDKALSYGELALLAAALPVPPEDEVTLRSRSDYRIVGSSPPRTDGLDIVTGRARYGLEQSIPGMLYASFERCPVIGGRVAGFDAEATLAVPGVRKVVPIDGSVSWMTQWSYGVAVVADSHWAAQEGRNALRVEWDLGTWKNLDSDAIRPELEAELERDGTVVRNDGDFRSFLDAAPGTSGHPDRVVEARYEAPYLSHAPLEPMNATVEVRPHGCTIRAPVQFPSFARAIAAKITGLDPSSIQVEIPLLGGGFGRRIYADYVGEAVLIAKAIGAPVQLLWTRVDETRHGFYRPWSVHGLIGVLGEDGLPAGWRHRIAGPSRDAVSDPEVETPERSEVYAAVEMPYAVPAVRVEFRHHYIPLPAGPWRSVGYSQGGFVQESFVDELAHAAGADPVAYRRRLLTRERFEYDDTVVEPRRMRAALDLAVEKAGWGAPMPSGRGRGVAVTSDHGSVVAHVAEVTVRHGEVRVDRVVTAIDCGLVIHPDMVRSQVEGAIAFGLSAALFGEITLRSGRVEQSSYLDDPVVRMPEMPEVEVYFVPSDRDPGGVGEPPLPGVAPAVCNAIFAATGRRIRRLPIAPRLEEASAASQAASDRSRAR